MVVALAFGAGPVTDAFFVAFRIPNILRRLLAEGAAEDVGDPEGDEKRVGHRPGAERERHDHVADEADHAAQQRGAADGAERADDLSFGRAHLEIAPLFGHDAPRATRHAARSEAVRGDGGVAKGAFTWRIRSRRRSVSGKTSDGGSAIGPCDRGYAPWSRRLVPWKVRPRPQRSSRPSALSTRPCRRACSTATPRPARSPPSPADSPLTADPRRRAPAADPPPRESDAHLLPGRRGSRRRRRRFCRSLRP